MYVGEIFELKNFCRVDVLRKYFNTTTQHYYCSIISFHVTRAHQERQARAGVKSERMYGDSNCHGKVFQKELYSQLPHTLWKTSAREVLVCEREPVDASDRYTVAVILSQEICLKSCSSGYVHCFCNGEVHSCKCERRVQWRAHCNLHPNV